MGVTVQWKYFCTPWKSLIKSNEKLKNLKIFDSVRGPTMTWCNPLMFTESKDEPKKASDFCLEFGNHIF